MAEKVPCLERHLLMYRVSSILLLCLWFASFRALADPSSAQEPQQEPQYVALGSSFASGPGIGEREKGSPLSCRRSADDYAHLYARAHKLSLDDRTCSGATTKDVLEGGQFGLGAQIEAVKASTKLVTVTIGGNDVFYIRNLYAHSCAHDPANVPTFLRDSPYCKAVPDADVDRAFGSLAGQFRRIVALVRQRAPAARLVFVNYVTVLPPTGTCAALPLSADEAAHARAVAQRLAESTRIAVEESGSELVDAATLSQNHDLCAATSWVQPFSFPKDPNGFAPFAYHPTAAAMQAVADHIDHP